MPKAFVKHLQGERLAQGSLVRIYATVRHFARWADVTRYGHGRTILQIRVVGKHR